jgi:hypothetical protein
VYRQGCFRSGPIDDELDSLLHKSWLVVVWFQEDLDRPVADFVTAAVHELDWESFAETLSVSLRWPIVSAASDASRSR